jgi:hypothetical protein
VRAALLKDTCQSKVGNLQFALLIQQKIGSYAAKRGEKGIRMIITVKLVKASTTACVPHLLYRGARHPYDEGTLHLLAFA